MYLSFNVFTLFPGLFPGPLSSSIVGRALDQNIWSLKAIDIRKYAVDKHRHVDDSVFGGGAGMVLRPDIIDNALQAHYSERPQALVYLSPRGRPIEQARIKQLANSGHVGLLCGRFEGVDERVLEAWNFEELSLGDFVMSGGEIAAMALIDACVRLLPQVLGSDKSLLEESFSNGLLEYPQYTRPHIWNEREVPTVLRSGHHQNIRSWRQTMAEARTQQYRPDLWQKYIKNHRKV